MRFSVYLLALTISAAASPLTTRQDVAIQGDGDIAPEAPSAPASPDIKDGGIITVPESPPPTDPLQTKEGLCEDWDLTTAEGVDHVWEETSAGAVLDLFIHSQGSSSRWVKNLEDDVRRGSSGKSGAPGCSSLGAECDPMDGLTCEEHVDTYGQRSVFDSAAYWVFQAVRGMHGKFNELNRRLVRTTLINDLKIPQMIDDFDGNEDDPSNTFAILAAAFTMGNGLASAVPGIGTAAAAGFGFLGGLFSLLASNGDEPIDQGSISSSLGETFERATGLLEDTLRIATGGGTSEEERSLPAPKWDTYRSSIAKFFNGGWFLLDDDAEIVNTIFDSIQANIQRKVASDIMKAANLHVAIDTRVKSEGDCKGAGRLWQDVGGDKNCLYLMRMHKDMTDNFEWNEAEPEVYESMKKYGLDNLERYYHENILCASDRRENREIDVGKLVSGEVPRCFFNLRVITVKDGSNPGCDLAELGLAPTFGCSNLRVAPYP